MEGEEVSSNPTAVGSLELVSTIGFEGSVPGGLISHPDGKHVIYSLGCKVIVKDTITSEQTFLTGHGNNVCCLDCSPSGRYLASGQITHMGFKADVIVWSFQERSLYCRFSLHKVKVQAVALSHNDKYLATLGGLDDNSIIIWDLQRKEAVCGNQAAMSSAGMVRTLAFSRCRDNMLVTGGDGTLRVWEFKPQLRKIIPTECTLGQLKRVVNCIQVSDDDQYMYCGTTSGDVMQINTNTCLIHYFGPQKKKFSQGVTVIQLLPSGNLLLGTGDGLIAEISGPPNFRRIRSSAKFPGSVTSVSLRGNGNQFFVGLNSAQIYKMEFDSFESSLLLSCHNTPITSIVFPKDSSDLFATSSRNDVRVWHAETGKELLRLTVHNLTCHAVEITPDGKAIITAWDDGKIRAYYPETGKLMYTIQDAHNKGVTALACTSNSRQVISGGGEGQVRIWNVTRSGHTSMREALKEHKGAITCIKITPSDEECVTSSTDGTCIIWDLVRFVRSQIIFANTMFFAVCYGKEGSQIITGGTDRKIGYWETYDGAQIRELDGSKSASINGMDVYNDQFITGSGDKLIKVWQYDKGDVTHIGEGHSGDITDVKISPDGQHIVSVSSDGAILRWKYPITSLQGTPAVGSKAGTPALDSKASTPAVGSKASTPAVGSKAGTPAAGSKAGTPALGSKAGTPGVGSKAGTPSVGSKAGTPSVGSKAGTPGAGYKAGTPGAGYKAGTPSVGSKTSTPGAGYKAGTPPPTSMPTFPAEDTKPNSPTVQLQQQEIEMGGVSPKQEE